MRDINGYGEMGKIGGLQGAELVGIGNTYERYYAAAQRMRPGAGWKAPSMTESLKTGVEWVRAAGWSGNVQGIGGLYKGIGDAPPTAHQPGHGNIGRRGALPPDPTEPEVTFNPLGQFGHAGPFGAQPGHGGIPARGAIPAIDGFSAGFGWLGQLGVGKTPLDADTGATRGDTRGFTTSDFVKTLSGHVEGTKRPDFGDVCLAHGGDKIRFGGIPGRVSKWLIYRRYASTKGGGWKSDKREVRTLQPGETAEFNNHENTLKDTDVDVYITLLEVGTNQQEADAVAKDKGNADTDIANAKATVASYVAAGGDNSKYSKMLDDADNYYRNAEYSKASASAKQASAGAISDKALLDKQALEKQKQAIQQDTTLSADTKKNMVENIEEQKTAIDKQAAAEVAETAPGFQFGMNIPTFAIVGVAALAIVGVGLAMRKK